MNRSLRRRPAAVAPAAGAPRTARTPAPAAARSRPPATRRRRTISSPVAAAGGEPALVRLSLTHV
ncbi:hypothetical protein [Streptomyces sp. CA-146814]|uniref:hypothetical protein n=1 Tax=Streptomyces sp. CA-146814 TaxID=3240053 RepID=UPI003D943310